MQQLRHPIRNNVPLQIALSAVEEITGIPLNLEQFQPLIWNLARFSQINSNIPSANIEMQEATEAFVRSNNNIVEQYNQNIESRQAHIQDKT